MFLLKNYYGSTEKLKEIHLNFLKTLAVDIQKSIDTTIYSEHWFRCPNQYKGSGNEKDKHLIQKGSMIDFVIEHIPKDSVSISDNVFIESESLIVFNKNELVGLIKKN